MKHIIVLIFLANLLLSGCTQPAKEQPTSIPIEGVEHAMQMLRIVTDVIFSMTEPTDGGGGGGGGSDKQGEGEGEFSSALTLQELCTKVTDELSEMDKFALMETDVKDENCESKWVMVQVGVDWLLILEIETTDQENVYKYEMRTVAP